MGFKEELDSIETQVNERKIKKAKLEERSKSLEDAKSKLLEELKGQGVTEDKLEETIMDLEVNIDEEIGKCKQLLTQK